LKNPQIYKSNFLIEIYFKTEVNLTGGVLMEKLNGAGYSLTINGAGLLAFKINGANSTAILDSKSKVNDAQWHHVIAEVNRKSRTLIIYLDGRKDASGEGLDASVSLANDGDVHVGGKPDGRYFDGTLDFLRIAQGTLADAETTIEELYAWEFDGPSLRDFTGRKPGAAQRVAGAIDRSN
jgi:hypothetical protein